MAARLLLSTVAIRALSEAAAAMEENALQLLLDANEDAIDALYGPLDVDVTEVVAGGLSVVSTSRPIAEITSVTERTGSTNTVLEVPEDADADYLFEVGSQWLTRSAYGPNGAVRFGRRVTIVYRPVADIAERKRVQWKLCELDATNRPGLTAETAGPFSRQYAANSVYNYQVERAAILASLGSADDGVPFR